MLLLVYGNVSGQIAVYYLAPLLWLAAMAGDILVPSELPGLVVGKSRLQSVWVVLIWLVVPLYIILIITGLVAINKEQLSLYDFLLAASVTGFSGSMIGVSVAHELMHRKGGYEQKLSMLVMLLCGYPQFHIQHLYCHHRNVGTIKDSATARLGEGFYDFFQRSIFEGLCHALEFEERRLHLLKISVYSLGNRMVQYFLALIMMYILVLLGFGWRGAVFMVVQAAIAITSLEIINYIQHYGLVRGRAKDKGYESIKMAHSWDSCHRLSNWILFNLPHHAQHHVFPGESYHRLSVSAEAPQLPFGYFFMFILALFPPLWRRVMDPRVSAWRRQIEVKGNV